MTIRKRIFISFSAILVILLAFGIYMSTLYQTLETHMADVTEISRAAQSLQKTHIYQTQFIRFGDLSMVNACISEIDTIELNLSDDHILSSFKDDKADYLELIDQISSIRSQIANSKRYLNQSIAEIIELFNDIQTSDRIDQTYVLMQLLNGINNENRYAIFNLRYDAVQLTYLLEIIDYVDEINRMASTKELIDATSSLSNSLNAVYDIHKDLIQLNDNLTLLTDQLEVHIEGMIFNMDDALNILRNNNQNIVKHVQNVYMVMFSFVLFIVIVVITQLTTRINSALRQLTESTERIAAGEYDSTALITGNDEFSRFATSINKMANKLKEAHASVLFSNNQLENIVTAKTLELQKTKDDLEHLNRKLTHEKEKYIILAMTDALTGLKNRAFLISYIDQAIKEAKRYKHPFSIMLLDIDFFKHVNDEYGHHTGDEVLKSLAEILNLECRQSDIISRYGGEEFIIVFGNTDLENAILTAERIRQRVAETSFTVEHLHITISAGVTDYKGEDTSKLIEHVDALQYQAKRNGRNCIVTDYNLDSTCNLLI